MQVTQDRKLLIAVGRSRKAALWQNKEIQWSELLDKLATTTRTRESTKEYQWFGQACQRKEHHLRNAGRRPAPVQGEIRLYHRDRRIVDDRFIVRVHIKADHRSFFCQ